MRDSTQRQRNIKILIVAGFIIGWMGACDESEGDGGNCNVGGPECQDCPEGQETYVCLDVPGEPLGQTALCAISAAAANEACIQLDGSGLGNGGEPLTCVTYQSDTDEGPPLVFDGEISYDTSHAEVTVEFMEELGRDPALLFKDDAEIIRKNPSSDQLKFANVATDSLAYALGFRSGDIIVAVIGDGNYRLGETAAKLFDIYSEAQDEDWTEFEVRVYRPSASGNVSVYIDIL